MPSKEGITGLIKCYRILKFYKITCVPFTGIFHPRNDKEPAL